MSSGRADLLRTVVVVGVCLVVGPGAAWLVGGDAVQLAGLPLTVWLVLLAFGVQWLAWVPASLLRSERFYDLTGSLTYLLVVGLGLVLRGQAPGVRELLVAGLVAVWALRLGSFLVRRIRQDGKDGRFDQLKASAVRFLVPWTVQGLWVSLTALAALVVITDGDPPVSMGLIGMLGLLTWVLGFTVEVVSDRQKRAFRARPESKGRFIAEGLWAWSRHPNYVGEIVLWLGVFLIGAETFHGLQWVALVSPVFVYLLLTRISGVPLLEDRAEEKWGGQADYEAYKAATPVLWPRPPRQA